MPTKMQHTHTQRPRQIHTQCCCCGGVVGSYRHHTQPHTAEHFPNTSQAASQCPHTCVSLLRVTHKNIRNRVQEQGLYPNSNPLNPKPSPWHSPQGVCDAQAHVDRVCCHQPCSTPQLHQHNAGHHMADAEHHLHACMGTATTTERGREGLNQIINESQPPSQDLPEGSTPRGGWTDSGSVCASRLAATAAPVTGHGQRR